MSLKNRCTASSGFIRLRRINSICNHQLSRAPEPSGRAAPASIPSQARYAFSQHWKVCQWASKLRNSQLRKTRASYRQNLCPRDSWRRTPTPVRAPTERLPASQRGEPAESGLFCVLVSLPYLFPRRVNKKSTAAITLTSGPSEPFGTWKLSDALFWS